MIFHLTLTCGPQVSTRAFGGVLKPCPCPLHKRVLSLGWGAQLTTPSLDSPVSDWDAEGLAHESVGLDGLTEERAIVPHAAQVIHAAVHKGCGVHHGGTLPQGAVRLIEEAAVVRAKVEGFGGNITLGTVVHAAGVTLPVHVIDTPALAQVQHRHGWPAVGAEEVIQWVFIIVPTKPTGGVYIRAWDGNGGVVLAIERH